MMQIPLLDFRGVLIDLHEDRANTTQSDYYKRLVSWIISNRGTTDVNKALNSCWVSKDVILSKCGGYPTLDKFCHVLLEELKDIKRTNRCIKHKYVVQFTINN